MTHSEDEDEERFKELKTKFPTLTHSFDTNYKMNLDYPRTVEEELSSEEVELVSLYLKNSRWIGFELGLSFQHLGDKGAKLIAEGLASNKSLINLGLYRTEIGDDGARHIAAALRSHPSLETLSLGGNLIGDDGAWHIGEALLSNTSLQFLGLEDNGIGDDGASQIGAALASNRSLKWLHLSI